MLWLINSICLGFLSLLSYLVAEIELQNFSSVSCHCGITVTIFKTSENICQWSENSLSKKAMPQSLYGCRSWQKDSQVAKEVKGSQNNIDSHNRNRLHCYPRGCGCYDRNIDMHLGIHEVHCIIQQTISMMWGKKCFCKTSLI